MITLTDRPDVLWARAHRTLVLAVVFAVVLLVTLAMAVALLAGGSPATASSPGADLPTIDDGCAEARPGTAC